MRGQDQDQLSKRLWALILEAGFHSIEDFAHAAGLGKDTVGRWLRGTTTPTRRNLAKAEEFLSDRLPRPVDLSAERTAREQARGASRADVHEKDELGADSDGAAGATDDRGRPALGDEQDAIFIAAVDLYRLRIPHPWLGELLMAAAPAYLRKSDPAEGWEQVALEQLTRAGGPKDSSDPLITVDRDADGVVRYTVDVESLRPAAARRRTIEIPTGTWTALDAHIDDPDVLSELDDAARRRGRHEASYSFARKERELRGATDGSWGALPFPRDDPTPDRPRLPHWTDARDLARRGDAESLETQADEGDVDAAKRLAGLLIAREDIAGLRQRADGGDPVAVQELTALLVRQGNVEELSERADAHDSVAIRALFELHKDRGASEAIRHRARRGDRPALVHVLAGGVGDDPDVERLRELADEGDPDAVAAYYPALVKVGDRQTLQTRADAGDAAAARYLVDLLAKKRDLAALRGRVEAGDGWAEERLAQLFYMAGDAESLTEVVDLPAGYGATYLARLRANEERLRSQQREDEAKALAEQDDLDELRVRADAGDAEAADWLAIKLAWREDTDELWDRTRRGDERASVHLARVLANLNDLDGLRALSDYGEVEAGRQLSEKLAAARDIEGLRAEVNAGTPLALQELERLTAPSPEPKAVRSSSRSLLDDVHAFTRAGKGVASVELHRDGGLGHLVVYSLWGERHVIGVVDGELMESTYQSFITLIHQKEQRRNPNARSVLVHRGLSVRYLLHRARHDGVVLKSWDDFRSPLDLPSYRFELSCRLEDDQQYSTERYVDIRYRRIRNDGSLGDNVSENLAKELVEDVAHERPLVALVLGEPGSGKTVLLRRVAEWLLGTRPEITPIVASLRDLDEPHDVDVLVADAVASSSGVVDRLTLRHRFPKRSKSHSEKPGDLDLRGLALLVDDYDDFARRLGRFEAIEQLRRLVAVTTWGAHLVLTSRPGPFVGDGPHPAPAFDLLRELEPGSRRLYWLKDFEEDQQRSFLDAWLTREGTRPTDGSTSSWMATLTTVPFLPDLAQSPNVLSLITGSLGRDQLGAAGSDSAPITSARLYEMALRALIAARNISEPALLLDVLEDVAFGMWADGRAERVVDASVEAVSHMPVVACERGQLRFLDRTVEEFLVARRLASVLQAGARPEELKTAEMSEVTARFLCEIAPEHVLAWLRSVGAA